MKNLNVGVGLLLLLCINCQNELTAQKKDSHLSGDFYLVTQYYLEDAAIGAIGLPGNENPGFNAGLQLNYAWKNLSVGLRYETYWPPLLGFERGLEGNGFGNRFVSYTHNNFELTLGNFYEQFGSGMTLRSYYEPQLGLDNSIDGARLKYNSKAMNVTAIVGKNRRYFGKDDSKIRGINADFFLGDFVNFLKTGNVSLDLGFSLVNKKELNTTGLNLPSGTTIVAGRSELRIKGFNFGLEYGKKGIEPHALNGLNRNEGQALFVSSGYSTKGFGFNVYWKYIDNMFFRSDRESASNIVSSINYLPPNSNINTYRLTTLYPYATQGNGENGLNADIFFNIKKGTSLGGKYGTKVAMDFSLITAIDKRSIALDEYETDFLAFSDSVYYANWNVEITKRVNKKLRYVAGWSYIKYNQDVIEGIPQSGFVKSLTFFTDITYRLPNRRFVRMELQHLSTQQHLGNWIFGLIEMGWSAKLSAYVSDEWNYDNSVHYYSLGFNYRKGATLVGLGYVRERSGLICVGGVCRVVPASTGFRLQVNTSF